MTILASAPRLPELASTRSQARRFLEALPEVARDELVLDCSDVRSAAPSFVDELVKVALREWGVWRLVLADPPERMARLAIRSAEAHADTSRVVIK